MTRDLFAPALAGLAIEQGLVSAGDEAKLIALLEELELAPFRFQGWTGNRLTRSFGWHYDFDDHSFSETDPLPAWLNPLRELAGQLAGEPAARFSHALITRYDPGAGIGWHRDRPIFDKVVGFSLVSPATLRFRRRTATGFDRRSILLEPRSAYLLSGEVRDAWEHSIAPAAELRYSITLRSVREARLRSAGPANATSRATNGGTAAPRRGSKADS